MSRAIGTPDEHVNTWLAAHRTSDAHTCVTDRLDRRRRRRAADRRRRRRARLRRRSRSGGSLRSQCLHWRSSRRRTAPRRSSCTPTGRASFASSTCRSTPATHRATRLPRSRSTAGSRCCSRRGSQTRVFATFAWTLAVAMVAFVATSRMYRGMHHPLDVAGGLVVGVAALIVVVFACRTAGAAARRRANMKVAVIAHSGKTLGGGLPSFAAFSRRKASTTRSGARCRRAARRPRRFAVRSTKARSSSSRGAATGWCSAASTCSPARRRASRSFRREPRTSSPTNLGIPKDIEEAVAIGLRGERRKLDVGRFNGERFGVMAGAGFDAAMIRDADGGLKDRFGRVAYVWTGSREPALEAVPRRRSRSTASAGTRARRAASCSATSASSSAASRRSRTRGPTTGSSSSAS